MTPVVTGAALMAVADDLRLHGPWWPGLDQVVLEILASELTLDWVAAQAGMGTTNIAAALARAWERHVRAPVLGVVLTRSEAEASPAGPTYLTPTEVPADLPGRALVLVRHSDLITSQHGDVWLDALTDRAHAAGGKVVLLGTTLTYGSHLTINEEGDFQ